MKTSTLIWVVVIAFIVIIGVWYWSTYATIQTSPGMEATTTTGQTVTTGVPTTSGSTAQVATVSVASDPILGNYLVASNGMTLYMYANDTSSVSKCTGTCAASWPPYTPVLNAPLTAGSGVSGALASTSREGGTLQVTYKGKPLYFWQGDTRTGDTTGNGMQGVWSVAKP